MTFSELEKKIQAGGSVTHKDYPHIYSLVKIAEGDEELKRISEEQSQLNVPMPIYIQTNGSDNLPDEKVIAAIEKINMLCDKLKTTPVCSSRQQLKKLLYVYLYSNMGNSYGK